MRLFQLGMATVLGEGKPNSKSRLKMNPVSHPNRAEGFGKST